MGPKEEEEEISKPRPGAMFPGGFNPLAGLQGLRKAPPKGAVAMPGMGGFNPAAALKGLKSTKRTDSESTEVRGPSPGGFDPAAALKGLKKSTERKNDETSK